jgi:hypothetical protein
MILKFGKHKGKSLDQITDTSYLDWLVKNFPGGEVKSAAMAELSRKVPIPQPVINTNIKKMPFKAASLVSHVVRNMLRTKRKECEE